MDQKEIDKLKESNLKADAVMTFVNELIGAFEANFVDDHKPTLATLYRCAQNHVNDNYGIDTPNIHDAWDERVAEDCRNGNKRSD